MFSTVCVCVCVCACRTLHHHSLREVPLQERVQDTLRLKTLRVMDKKWTLKRITMEAKV